jgi:hypothetical protein
MKQQRTGDAVGQMSLFIEFVKQGGLSDSLVADCPRTSSARS